MSMTGVQATPEQNIPDLSDLRVSGSSATAPTRPQRVLACLLCHRRKVKCDHKFPCGNCIKSQAPCVPGTAARRQHRRSPPKRELLERLRNYEDRIRKYEDLLRENKVNFGPLMGSSAAEKESTPEGIYDSDDEHPESVGPDNATPSTTVKSEDSYEARNFWHIMRRGFQDSDEESNFSSDDLHDFQLKRAWVELYEGNDLLLLGLRKTPVDLSTMHPEPVHMFRLWQVYLDNVNPLFKIVHTPTMQGRIIEAASNVKSMSHTLEALMFSIYCVSILSLDENDCLVMFGLPRKDLLTGYQFGCQQALLNSAFLRSTDPDCLTALFLYLVSVARSTDPGSLSSVLGIAFRVAQRMGIHNESEFTKHSPFEAEIRRRLWWALILFDSRIGEMADYKSASLTPTWNCKTLLNANDSDLHPGMKEPPAVQSSNPTEALFAVVRSELGDFLRNSTFHLNFTNPALKPVAKDIHHGPIPESGEIGTLEKMIEEKYLKYCNPEIPLHFMTIWMTRAQLAKYRLVEHYSRISGAPSTGLQTSAQRNTALGYSFDMLEFDTKIMNSPLTKGYRWITQIYFPLPAYVHISREVKRRPTGEKAEQAWKIMSDNYEARIRGPLEENKPLFNLFTGLILPAWDARQAAHEKSGEPLALPRIITFIKDEMARMEQEAQANSSVGITGPSTSFLNLEGIDNYLMSLPTSLLGSIGGQDDLGVTGLGEFPNMAGQDPLSAGGLNQVNWAAMDWSMK